MTFTDLHLQLTRSILLHFRKLKLFLDTYAVNPVVSSQGAPLIRAKSKFTVNLPEIL